MSTPQKDRVGVMEKIGYGLGDFGSNIVFQAILLLLPLFYTDVFGLGAATMGTMFLVVRVLDAISDPIMGAICDNTQTRMGKFRPYLMWLAAPFALFCVVSFITPPLGGTGKVIYAYVTYSLLMLAYTAINIPYCALGGVISADSQERVSLNSYRFVLATLAGVLIASSTLPLVKHLGNGDDRLGFPLAMACFSVLAIGSFIACFLFCRERVQPVHRRDANLKADLLSLARNDQWLVVALLFFFLLVPIVLRSGAAAYYIKWYAGREDLIAPFLTAGAVCQMAGASLSSRLSEKLSMVQAYVLIQVLVAVGSLALYFVQRDQLVGMFCLYGFTNFFVQMGAPLLFAMTADAVDYGELKTGRRITGLVFSGGLFALKLGVAVGGALLAWLLAWYGYQSGGQTTVQSVRTEEGIVLLMSVIPAAGHLLLIPIVSFYKLGKLRCREIRRSLDAQRQSAPNHL